MYIVNYLRKQILLIYVICFFKDIEKKLGVPIAFSFIEYIIWQIKFDNNNDHDNRVEITRHSLSED